MKRNWVACINCEYNSVCKTGSLRIEGLDYNSLIAQDIGCFGFEIYNLQNQDKQLNLFKHKDELY